MSDLHAIGEVAWVAVLDHTNTVEHRTPHQILTEPARYRALADADPMHRVATMRFLTALHLAASAAGGLDAYLAKWNDRFYLRDVRYPFYQHADLDQTLDEEGARANSLAVIDWRRAKGNTPVLWDHTTTDTQLSMTAPEVIPALLWSASASPGGPATRSRRGKVKSTATHAPNGPVASYCQALGWGDSLAATLAAIERTTVVPPSDQPVWEREDPLVLSTVAKPRDPYLRVEPTGPLAWLTWPARQQLLAWTGANATGAVAVPGWYTPEDWPGRLAVDPFAPVSPKDPEKAMHATQIHQWREVALPPYLHVMREHGPVAVEFIAQQLNKAKLEGCNTRRLRLEPEVP